MPSTKYCVSSVAPLSVENEEEFSLTKGLHSKRYTSLSISAARQPFYAQHCLRSTLRLFHSIWYQVSGFKKYSDTKFSLYIRDSQSLDTRPNRKSVFIPDSSSFRIHSFECKGWFPVLRFFDLRIRTECSEHVNSFIDAHWAYVRKHT